VAEIAALLKVNQQTVRNWIDRGELASVRAGARRVRVRRRDLEAYLQSSRESVRNRRAGDLDEAKAAVQAATRAVQASISAGDEASALLAALRELRGAVDRLLRALAG